MIPPNVVRGKSTGVYIKRSYHLQLKNKSAVSFPAINLSRLLTKRIMLLQISFTFDVCRSVETLITIYHQTRRFVSKETKNN